MFKDLMLCLTATPGDEEALAAGVSLAGAFSARLTVLRLLSLPRAAASTWGMVPDAALADVYRRLRAQGEVELERLRARLAPVVANSEARLVEAALLAPGRIAARQAHCADLCIVAGPDAGADGEAASAYFLSLLLESGRPVLMVPPGSRVMLPAERVMVAWRPAREAARAVHDALPLLMRASAVDVLAVDARDADPAEGDTSGAELALHLGRRGIDATLVRRDSGSRPVSAVLLEHAREHGAQMIVAGGYGHSRLREWALGGVTRELLKTASVPVLYSH